MQVVPIHFQDLDFRHTFAMCRTRAGEMVRRWVPYGMPRFRPDIERVSFYLYRLDPRPHAKVGALQGPFGSGVVIELPASNPMLSKHVYAVTAAHVVATGASIIRLNTKNDDSPDLYGHRFMDELTPDDWVSIPGGHDVAVADITDQLREGDWIRAARDVDFVTRDFIKQKKIGLGEDGFMLGLYVPSPGKKYNLPATRFGNIARLADDQHPVPQGHQIAHPSHIFDIHSRPGYSGSPVFLYRTPANDLTGINPKGHWDLNTTNNVFLALLGIHSGQFPDEINVETSDRPGAKEIAEIPGDPIHEGDKLFIPSSMTIVVPAWAIIDVLNLPIFKEQRTMRERKELNDGTPKIMPEAVEPAPPATDANPNHREDFTSLLTSAVRKPESKD